MIDFLIISDDLTGALDTGVKFSSRNIPTLVTSDINIDINGINSDIKVLVVNNETRTLTGSKAYQKTLELLNNIDTKKYKYLYKKIDSGFRGNIGNELKAIMDFYGEVSIPIIAAYPDMNRTVQKGLLYIDDVKVEDSVFSKDPFEPVKESSIKKILHKDIENEIYNIDLLEDSDFAINTKSFYIFDGKTNEDLDATYEFLKINNLKKVMVGCAGFADILAKKLSNDSYKVMDEVNYPLAIISGSLNPVTIDQIEEFKKNNGKVFNIETEHVNDKNYFDNISNSDAETNLQNAFNCENKVVFENYSMKYISDYDNFDKSVRFNIASAMARLTKYLIENIGYRDFVVVGGDTLYAILESLNINEIYPIREIFPGVVVSKIKYKNNTIRLASKSGGFGDKNLMKNL